MLRAPSCKYLGNCLLLATHCYFSQVSFQTNPLPATSFKYPPEGRRGRMTGACKARGWRKICYPSAELRFAFSLHSLPSSLSFIPSPPSPGSTMLTSSPGRSRARPFGKASDGGHVCGAFVVVLCHHEPQQLLTEGSVTAFVSVTERANITLDSRWNAADLICCQRNCFTRVSP